MRAPRGHPPWGQEHVLLILYKSDVILMNILDVIFMHILYVLIRMHTLDVSLLLLLMLATTVIAPLFSEFQPQSNNAAGSVVGPQTTVLSSTTVHKHKYALWSRQGSRVC